MRQSRGITPNPSGEAVDLSILGPTASTRLRCSVAGPEGADDSAAWIQHGDRSLWAMDDALQALVADLGSGNVLDAEMLEGCTVEPHELDEMDEHQAAIVAAHVFEQLFDHEISHQFGESADPEEGRWSGTVDGFLFVIERDAAGDLVLDFSPAGQ